jgi:polyisoprenoid-binding protein YceI
MIFSRLKNIPQAKLVITSVTPKGGNAYDVTGKLTIKGITEEVKFPATLTADAKKVTANAKVRLTVLNMTSNSVQLISSKTLVTRRLRTILHWM